MPYGNGTQGNPWSDYGVVMGGGGSGNGQQQPGYNQPPNFQGHVQSDPNMNWWLDKAKGFLDTSTLDKQKQAAGQDIDAGAAAQSRALEGMMSRRGIGDSGVGIQKQSENADMAQRAKNRTFMDLDVADKSRRDQLLMGTQGGFAEPGRMQMQQSQNQFNNWMGMNNMYSNQQNSAFSQMMAMMGMFKPQGGYGGGNSGYNPPHYGGGPGQTGLG